MLRAIVFGALIACLTMGVAYAQDAAEADGTINAYGYTMDDVAVNQGIVLYWYAHGYANCYGCPPKSFAEMTEKGLLLRKFMSPHTGDEIDPDDGSLDFNGDMIYMPAECGDVGVHIQTSTGVVELPGYVCGHSDVSVQFDPCCCLWLCPGGACIYEGWECWDICGCGGDECACTLVQWMMWNSFETHEVLFGIRPADELAWYASGLAPIDKNYKEYAPSMDIEFIYKSAGYCCFLKKAYVHCCAPCVPCTPCKPVCDPCNPCVKSCNKCAAPCESRCNPCKPKCKQNTCTKQCEPKCDPCAKPCEPKCDPCCKPCEPKCDPCAKPVCDPCKPKCEQRCKPKCDPCG